MIDKPSPYDASLGPVASWPKSILTQLNEDREARMRQESDSILEAYIRRAIRAEQERDRVIRRHREFVKMITDAIPAMKEYLRQLPELPNKPLHNYADDRENAEYWLARAGEIVAEFGE